MDLQGFFAIFVVIINFISALAILSQVRLTYHRKNTIGLSRTPILMGTTNAFVGLIYSLMIQNLPFIFANFAWFTMNGLLLSLILYYGRAAKPTIGVEQQ